MRRGLNTLTPTQARAARAVLDLSVQLLAKQSGISASSIRRVEDGTDVSVTLDLVVRLQDYFEKQGIEFDWEPPVACMKWPEPAPTPPPPRHTAAPRHAK